MRVKVRDLVPLHSPEVSGVRSALEALSDEELIFACDHSRNGDPIKISTVSGKVVDGNGRAYELMRRAANPQSKITFDAEIECEAYTPDNSMFSFQLGVTTPEEEEASSVESTALPEDVKVMLQEILQLLNHDISQLVQMPS